MHFDPSYFEGEVREGFYVKPMMKRVWAAQLEVLHEVDIICKRHNIRYYAEYGTLLGAIRHKGFVPWDDDLDIGMTRQEYVRFIHYASKELPEGYRIINPSTEENFVELVTRVINSTQISTEPKFLEKFHGCPYMIGLDIFVTDRVPKNKGEEELQLTLLAAVNSLGRNWDEESMDEDEKWLELEMVEEITKVKVDRSKPIKQQLMILATQICAMYWDAEADEATLIPKLAVNPDYRLPISCFEAPIIEMPFENTTVPVLTTYDQILTRRYGHTYMTPRQYSNHGYPFYQFQEDKLFDYYRKHNLPIPDCFKE